MPQRGLMNNGSPKYKRIILKVTGEVFAGPHKFGIDGKTVKAFAQEIQEVKEMGCELALVIGGGNIFRGAVASEIGMDRASADTMGMLATVINSLALQDALEKLGVSTRVLSAIEMRQVAEPYMTAPSHAAPGERSRGDLRWRDWQPLLYDRYHGQPSGDGSGC